jgi:anti-sigma factor RsiW
MTAMEHSDAVAALATERYLLGEMTDTERNEFEAHFFACEDCAEDVRAGALLRDGIRQGLASPATKTSGVVVQMAPRRSWRPSVVLPWAVAATLAVMVGYQSRSVRPTDEGRAAGIIALTPTTLRPATRGREQTVAAGLAAALAVDVADLGSDGPLHYTLTTADGKPISAGDVTAPPPGAPLLLLLPTSVRPSQHYILKIENPRNAALTPEDYRFTVSER